VTTYETDAARASALLEEAGWTDADGDGVREKDGETLHVTISFTNDFGTLAAAMSGVKAQLEAVGFSVELAPAADMMGWFMAAMTGSYDLIYWETNGGAMDPSSTVSNIGSMADPVLGQLPGFGSITNELIGELDTTPSLERVPEIYRTILTSIADEALVIPLVYKNETAVWNGNVIADYDYYYDANYTLVQNIRLK
jgi:nickel transport system substrate-binding protein